jgi:hypothetical protein
MVIRVAYSKKRGAKIGCKNLTIIRRIGDRLEEEKGPEKRLESQK